KASTRGAVRVVIDDASERALEVTDAARPGGGQTLEHGGEVDRATAHRAGELELHRLGGAGDLLEVDRGTQQGLGLHARALGQPATEGAEELVAGAELAEVREGVGVEGGQV